MTRISSKKYLAGSKGQKCAFDIPGVCNHNPETVVPCHIRDRHTGGAQKASDISVVNGCSDCHDRMDGRRPMPDGEILSGVDWYYYALRGLQETLEQRHEAGLLIIPLDAPKPSTVKPRKPKSGRTKIPSRQWPKRQIRREI